MKNDLTRIKICCIDVDSYFYELGDVPEIVSGDNKTGDKYET